MAPGIPAVNREEMASDPRIQIILDLLLQLASGNLEVRALGSEDGDEIDAIITGVSMLGEELSTSFTRLQDSHSELEERVRVRTAELASVNEQLRFELAERVRAEQTLREAQEQLLHAQKMEAVGRLAGGVAHDFNNVLSVINGMSGLLLDDLRPSDPMRSDLEEIQKAGQHAAALTRQLLAFSRRQVLQPEILDLNAAIAGLNKMLRRLVREDIDLTTLLAAELGAVKVDPGQLEQAIVNLVVNARDAMPSGGKLVLETANVVVDDTHAVRLGVPAGDYVRLCVSDTGVGMDKETQRRIFEPFFTTKTVGKGTGLGLSTVYGIVQQCAGCVHVSSVLGKGTAFEIHLPRADESPFEDDLVDSRRLEPRGGETILIVEDEEQVRVVARSILHRRGYVVLEAKTPGDALLICERNVGDIDLLITDVVMPELRGPALAERVVAMRPSIRVLFMSGYTDDDALRDEVSAHGVAFLQKPLTPDLLTRKVQEVLGRAPGSPAR